MGFDYDSKMRSGGGKYSFIFHIAGMDWAACSDGNIVRVLELDDVDPAAPSTQQQNAITMRKQMFNTGYESDYFNTANYVKLLPNLDLELGTQTIDFGEQRGLEAGSFNTKFFGGKWGYTWRWSTNIECQGVMGLDVQPLLSTPGAKCAVLSRDFEAVKISTTGWGADLYWWIDRDEGLKTFIDAQLTAGTDVFLWVGNSCLYVNPAEGYVKTSGDEYYIQCFNQCFNTPNEWIFKDNENGLETLRITNYPQRIKDAETFLYPIHWDVDLEAGE